MAPRMALIPPSSTLSASFHNTFYAPRVPPRRRSRKFSRKFVKKSYFANFSDAPDARGHRELPVVKISALNDPWRHQKRQTNENKKSEFFTISELSFSSFLIDFGGARLFLTSKSSSSRFFALDGQIFRSVRRLGLIFRFFMSQHEAPRACKSPTTLRAEPVVKGRVGVNPYPFMG